MVVALPVSNDILTRNNKLKARHPRTVHDTPTITTVRSNSVQEPPHDLLIREGCWVFNIDLEYRVFPRPVVSPVASDMPEYDGRIWGAASEYVNGARSGRRVHFVDSVATALRIITPWGEVLIVDPRAGNTHVTVGDVQRAVIGWMHRIEQSQVQGARFTQRSMAWTREMEQEWRSIFGCGEDYSSLKDDETMDILYFLYTRNVVGSRGPSRDSRRHLKYGFGAERRGEPAQPVYARYDMAILCDGYSSTEVDPFVRLKILRRQDYNPFSFYLSTEMVLVLTCDATCPGVPHLISNESSTMTNNTRHLNINIEGRWRILPTGLHLWTLSSWTSFVEDRTRGGLRYHRD
ncbi:hypothetical protein P691DRAFT_791980 [Macrolepiota fuliginosa MF-IS2]|uniref:Uncharacterized protein n=1 Tax=Macrolepiota fuliginosa MF-IS2 TaxID=1400762 RepID=A0A9P5XCF3_9AGAR|nr:hypothetical protein P691DRAFT_791980 [Macrolepiota fuliginosa MF-IS2]